MRYGEWLLDPDQNFVIGCERCNLESPCGCIANQTYWCLDMDASVDDEDTVNGGCECVKCGATWTDTEMRTE